MKARLFRLVSFSAAAGLAVFGVMLTLQVRSNLEDRRQTDFEVETSKFTVEVETALTRLQDRIHALVALFETSQEVTEAEFEHFLDVTGMFEETSVLGVAVAPVVKADRVDELNAALARRWESRMLLGYPSLTLTPRGNRSDFMPVVYFESRGLSRDAVGEDLARLPALRLAAERALAGTGPQLSAPQRLAGASDRTPPNMMLIGATEHGRLGLRPDRTDESNPAVIAYDFTPAILIADLFARSRPDRFALQVHDVTGTAPLLVARLEEPAAEERFNHVETIEVAGRRWRLSYMPGPAFVAQGSLIWLYVMSGVALLLLGALAVAVDQLIKRREELARRVEERTAQLVVMNEQLAEARSRSSSPI
jgi:CHASE1-domain containing sensor protein